MSKEKRIRRGVDWLQIIAWIIGFSALAIIAYGIIKSIIG
tara:strand:- start:1808 stop:1927 length:120 start_codon:yes stop_codon:yes gene_type:complete